MYEKSASAVVGFPLIKVETECTGVNKSLLIRDADGLGGEGKNERKRFETNPACDAWVTYRFYEGLTFRIPIIVFFYHYLSLLLVLDSRLLDDISGGYDLKQY